MATIRLRIRGPSGTSTITLPEAATWGELRRAVSDATSLPAFDLRYGYPPQTLGSASLDADIPLSALGVNLNGEQITVAPLEAPPVPTATKPGTASAPGGASSSGAGPPLSLTRKKPDATLSDDVPTVPVPSLGGVLTLRVMPDDNSCLFRALSSALLGDALDGMTELRARVAAVIHDDGGTTYSSAVLEGKTPAQYCTWIQDPDSWGGGIELAILSREFGVEVCCVNVQDLRVDRFDGAPPSEDGRRRKRVVVVYSGIHYDVVALTAYEGADPGEDVKVFDVVELGGGQGEGGGVEEDDGGVLEAARELCGKLRQRHYYTDTKGFALRCNVCGWTGNGEAGATRHASETGHMDFGES